MSSCHDLADLLIAELDGTLSSVELERVHRHVATCAECRRQRKLLAATPVALRAATTVFQTPDAEREFQKLRHRLRTTPKTDAPKKTLRQVLSWGVPLAAAAAVAVLAGLFQGPTPSSTAQADYVQSADGTSTLVYVDQESGWLIVWADTGTGAEPS